jgi:hypothetical protein
MPNTSHSIIVEIVSLAMAWISTLFMADWVMEVVSATCVLMIAKITDHYFRDKVIEKIDQWRIKWDQLKEKWKNLK